MKAAKTILAFTLILTTFASVNAQTNDELEKRMPFFPSFDGGCDDGVIMWTFLDSGSLNYIYITDSTITDTVAINPEDIKYRIYISWDNTFKEDEFNMSVWFHQDFCPQFDRIYNYLRNKTKHIVE